MGDLRLLNNAAQNMQLLTREKFTSCRQIVQNALAKLHALSCAWSASGIFFLHARLPEKLIFSINRTKGL
jgi:hypothetical protein